MDPYIRFEVGEADDEAVATPKRRALLEAELDAAGLEPVVRRMMQQILIPLPAGFTPQPPSALPNLMIPIVWHMLRYK